MVHPFPSLLNGFATVAFALLAGGEIGTCVRLGFAMTVLQFSIGALNDINDAPIDGGRTPPKPIPAGFISAGVATVVAVGTAIVGLALSIPSGGVTVTVALTGLACGYAYDLRLARTAWSWLPLAVALPLVPVYAWIGAVGTVPREIYAIVPSAVLAGAALAIGNALVDHGLAGASGGATFADRWGPRRAWAVHAAALSGGAGLAIGWLPSSQSSGEIAIVVVGVLLAVVGMIALRVADQRRRRLAWQVEAFGVAVLGIGWFLTIGPRLPGA